MKQKSAGPVAIMLLVMNNLFTDSNFLASVGRSIAMCIIPIIVTIVIVLLALFVTAI